MDLSEYAAATPDEYAAWLDKLARFTGDPPDPRWTVTEAAYGAADGDGRKLLSKLLEKAFEQGFFTVLDRARADAAMAELVAEVAAGELLHESEAGRAVLELAAAAAAARARVERIAALGQP